MARLFPPTARVATIRVATSRDIVTDQSEAAFGRVPRNGRVVGIDLGCDQMTSVGGGGDAPHTDVAAKVTAKTGGDAARELMSARAAVGAASAVVKGGLAGSLSTTLKDLRVLEGDVLTLDLDITGGTNPISRGCWANVFIALD